MQVHFIITKTDDGFFIGSVEEHPGVLTQGQSVEETKENLLDALQLYLDCEPDEQTQS